jgi:hypothetical protein
MLFNELSIQFKIAVVSIWIFPFLVLAALTRDWLLWFTKIAGSVSSVFLFTLSFFLYMLIGIDFTNGGRMHMTTADLLRGSFLMTVVFYPGLVLVIILGTLSAIFRPEFPNILAVAFLAFLFHLLYLLSVIVLASQ